MTANTYTLTISVDVQDDIRSREMHLIYGGVYKDIVEHYIGSGSNKTPFTVQVSEEDLAMLEMDAHYSGGAMVEWLVLWAEIQKVKLLAA